MPAAHYTTALPILSGRQAGQVNRIGREGADCASEGPPIEWVIVWFNCRWYCARLGRDLEMSDVDKLGILTVDGCPQPDPAQPNNAIKYN